MEEYIYKLVTNTINNYSKQEAIKIIADKILWYEMKILKLTENKEE